MNNQFSKSTNHTLSSAWGPIRESLGQFSFNDIKTIVGLAGIDLTKLSAYQQTTPDGKTMSKGTLLSAIDGIKSQLNVSLQNKCEVIVTEEILNRNPNSLEKLQYHLSRLGWILYEGKLISINLFNPNNLKEVKQEVKTELLKAATRFRDGDLSGTITAICGAIEIATSEVYREYKLGNKSADSFQQTCAKSLSALEHKVSKELNELHWDEKDINSYIQNLKGTVNQGAYLIQSIRSKMGDVHGSKLVHPKYVFEILKIAEVIVMRLSLK